MKSIPIACKTKLVEEYNINLKRTEEEGHDVFEWHTKRKYACPKCDSIRINIRRLESNLAEGRCDYCGHDWLMQFRPGPYSSTKHNASGVPFEKQILPYEESKTWKHSCPVCRSKKQRYINRAIHPGMTDSYGVFHKGTGVVEVTCEDCNLLWLDTYTHAIQESDGTGRNTEYYKRKIQ